MLGRRVKDHLIANWPGILFLSVACIIGAGVVTMQIFSYYGGPGLQPAVTLGYQCGVGEEGLSVEDVNNCHSKAIALLESWNPGKSAFVVKSYYELTVTVVPVEIE